MKSEHIQPFIKATQNAFSEVVYLKTTPGNPYVFQGSEDLFDISAIIGLAGDARGAVILSFPLSSCLKISKSFTGIQSDEVNEVVTDAIGELVNIIAGNSKEGLLQYKIYISLPKVIIGNKMNMILPKNAPSITVPFSSEMGNFNLTVCLMEER